MRYLLVIFLAACTFPPQNQQSTSVFPVSAPIEIQAKEEVKPDPKEQKPRPARSHPGTTPAPPCTDLDTGDVKESINLKLDCLLDGK